MPMRYRLRRPSAFFLVKEREEDDEEEEEEDVVVGLESNGVDVDMDMDHRNEDGHDSKVDQVGDDGYYDQDDDDDDVDEDDLPPYSIRSSHSVASDHRFSDVESVLMAVSRGEIKLRRAEGLRFAYINDMMFIDGEVGTIQHN